MSPTEEGREAMLERTTLVIDECVLEPVCCDWKAGRFTCQVWTPPWRTPGLDALMQALFTRQLKTCHYRPARGGALSPVCLSFAAYIYDWRCDEARTGQHRHTISLVMSGAPWRENDTPVESAEALWDLLLPERAGPGSGSPGEPWRRPGAGAKD